MLSLYSYITFNILLVVSYVVTRGLLATSFFKNNFSQKFQLQFARYSFILCVTVFALFPFIKEILPAKNVSTLQIIHIARNTSEEFLNFHPLTAQENMSILDDKYDFSLHDFLILFIITGILTTLLYHIKNILRLRSIAKKSFCKHKIKNIHILLNDEIDIPFCWSTLTSHFIILPIKQSHNHLKMSLRHELQHIRQHDGYWLHFLNILKIINFWNPIMKFWLNYSNELQEFGCDEAVILRHTHTSISYAECLSQIATQNHSRNLISSTMIGISGTKKSILLRRINMIFNYRQIKHKAVLASFAYALSVFTTASTAFALNNSDLSPLTRDQLAKIITHSNLDTQFEITATPELVAEINKIRNDNESREELNMTLQRMQPYQPEFSQALEKHKLPTDLLAIPFIESGYQQLTPEVNPVQAAGIWQIVPTTGKKYGLRVDANNDERMNPTLATQAAINYLTKLHNQFGSWKLAVIAYEYGENQIADLVTAGHSHNAWTLATSSDAPKNLKEFITKFDAAVVIMHNPTIIQG